MNQKGSNLLTPQLLSPQSRLWYTSEKMFYSPGSPEHYYCY